MRRRITHGRQAGEKLARRWLREAGVPTHIVGFSSDAEFYLILHCYAGGTTHDFHVPCWGAQTLRRDVGYVVEAVMMQQDHHVRAWRQQRLTSAVS